MKRALLYAGAVALVLGWLVTTPALRAEDRAADKNTTGEKWAHGRIYTMMTQVTEAAVSKGGFDDVVERFVDADRHRIDQWIKDKANKDKLDKLDGRVAQFQKDWKDKYGHNFNIHHDDVVWGNAEFGNVALGEVGRTPQLAGEKVPAAQTDKTFDKERKMDEGRNVGYFTINPSHAMPGLKVPLVHQLPDVWKIDVPDNIDGQMLYDNLLKHLTMANEMKAQWPADENDAYRMVGHHVLMAILGVDENAKGTAAGQLGGDSVKHDEKK